MRPGPYLQEEGGSIVAWSADCYGPEDILLEWDYMFESGEVRLYDEWYALRPTTPEELADEDLLYDLFGDWEMEGTDTSTVYNVSPPERAGAFKFWTVNRPQPWSTKGESIEMLLPPEPDEA